MNVSVKNNILSLTTLIVAFALTVLVIMLGNHYLSSIRVDMTENKIYSVSQGTKNILQNLSEPLKIQFFYSSKLSVELPGISVYADRVKDMLNEYRRISGGKIIIEHIDPEPFSENEDLAVASGIDGIPIDQIGNSFYFGLLGTNSIDGIERIAFFSPEREQQLEYDLTHLIQGLASNVENKIGIISTLPVQGNPQGAMQGMPSQPWYSLEQLTQLYDLSYLEQDSDSIDPALSALLVIQPEGLPRHTLFAIDQYALQGGKIIIFVDPLAESDQQQNQFNPQADEGNSNPDDLQALLSSWGVSVSRDSVVADIDNALRVQSSQTGLGEVIDYPLWFLLNQNNMNADEPVFVQLGELVIASSGVVEPTQQATTQFTALLKTSKSASMFDLETLKAQTDPKELLTALKPGDSELVIAARISGKASTAFPDYSPEQEIDETSESKSDDQSTESQSDDLQTQAQFEQTNSGEINIVAFADTDLLQDQFWVQVQNFMGNPLVIPSAGNGRLIANLVDQMSGSPDLISVRNRGTANRPFTLLESIRQSADRNFLQKEQELSAQLQDTENKLLELEQAKNAANSAILTADQQLEIDNFTQNKIDIRKQLRQVRHSLQKDIEHVETLVKWVNMALIPFIIIIAGILVLYLKSRRID